MKLPSLTLRSRLIAGIAFVGVVLVVVSVVLTTTIRNELLAQVDQRLESLSPGRRDGGAPPWQNGQLPTRNPGPAADPGAERISDVYQGFVTPDGLLVTLFAPNYSGDESPPPAIDATAIAGALANGRATLTVDALEGGPSYRVLLRQIGDVVSVTAVPIDSVTSTISRLIWVEVLGSLAILVAIALVGWWMVHLGIRPLKKMTETATVIAHGDLGVRVPEQAAGTEAGDLAVALNQMLARIEGALDERAESEQRLRRFVSDASHELRTPVSAIRGYAELFRIGALDDPDQLADAMRRTEQEAMRMGRLINDMLVLARLDEQRPLVRRPVDLAAVARDVAADAHAADPTRTITVDAPDEATLIGDEDRLRQVVANVVGNALVHTASTVELAVTVNPDEIEVRVTDHGDGMSPEVAARVTERFFRADPSRSRHSGGSGLGLAIVDSAVSAHGGSVEIDSTPGKGTTVHLRFPIEPPAAPDSQQAVQPS